MLAATNYPFSTRSQRVFKGPCTQCKSSDAYEKYADGHSHCYSCGHHVRPEGEALIEAFKNTPKKSGPVPVNLPSDCDTYIPAEPNAWLIRYQLTVPEIRQNRIMWSEKRQSLVFPIVSSDTLQLYQSRYFGNDPKEPKWRTIGNKGILHIPERHKKDRRICLVEDLISAIKCSRVTNSAPLFGTSISPILASQIKKEFDEVLVWLDPDAQLKTIKNSLVLGEFGLRVRPIFSEHDPKEYLTFDLRRMMNKKEDE